MHIPPWSRGIVFNTTEENMCTATMDLFGLNERGIGMRCVTRSVPMIVSDVV